MNASKENAAKARAKLAAVRGSLPSRDAGGKAHLDYIDEFLAAAAGVLPGEKAAPVPEKPAAPAPTPDPEPKEKK